jgi:hypothetical protein
MCWPFIQHSKMEWNTINKNNERTMLKYLVMSMPGTNSMNSQWYLWTATNFLFHLVLLSLYITQDILKMFYKLYEFMILTCQGSPLEHQECTWESPSHTETDSLHLWNCCNYVWRGHINLDWKIIKICKQNNYKLQ